MGITLKTEDTGKGLTLIWFCDELKDTLLNPNGISHQHVTAIVQGVLEFRFGDKTIVLKAGEEIVLPLKEAYDVVAIEVPAEVHCFYSNDVAGAVESAEHLRTEQEKEFPTFDEAAALPKSDTIVDKEGKPVPSDPKDPIFVDTNLERVRSK